MPFEHAIIEKTDTEAGWVLNLPITIGFINFDSLQLEELPGVNDVGTITFLPGLEYQYPVTPNWTLIPLPTTVLPVSLTPHPMCSLLVPVSRVILTSILIWPNSPSAIVSCTHGSRVKILTAHPVTHCLRPD